MEPDSFDHFSKIYIWHPMKTSILAHPLTGLTAKFYTDDSWQSLPHSFYWRTHHVRISVLNGSVFFFGFRFGLVLGSVRESANRYFFELICGLIYVFWSFKNPQTEPKIALKRTKYWWTEGFANEFSRTIFKFTNRTEIRTKANRKPRSEPKFFNTNS